MSEPTEARLVLEFVGDARAPIELPRSGVMTIGCADQADVVVDGQGVADIHCAIGRAKGGGWALKDLGSEYGVLVNGEKVQSKKLEAGDLLLIGSRRVKVVDADARPRAETLRPASIQELPAGGAKAGEGGGGSRLPQVKGYRIEKPLGRGGMGEVYLAVQESLGRPVALKVLAAKFASDTDFVKRFQAEARAAAALNHPNVVTVHDVWEDSGRHFLAMEFMDRGNLEQRVAREGRLAPQECIDVLHDAAKALVFAEMRGIVHRDIKPANLMQNSVGTTKVADLGLAMHLEAEATESDNKKIYGTPHFISPEQARGEKVDIRSDLYSLGATLYRLLSGRTPFEGATTRDILRGHFLDAPKPLVELVPGVPPELARIVHRMLQKKPDERFPSASVLLQEVERLRSAALHGALPPVRVASGSRRGPWIALGVAALAVVAAVAIFGRGDGPAPPRPLDPPPVSGDGTRSDAQGVGSLANAGQAPTATGSGEGDSAPQKPDRPPPDDDTALKLRETEAELAYATLPRDLTPAERRTELAALVERFAGTTAAGHYADEAEQLRLAILRAEGLSSARDKSVREFLERVRLAGRADELPKPLADALRAMLAEPTPPELEADASVLAARRTLFADVIHIAAEACRASLAEADRHEAAGEFEKLEGVLRPYLGALDAPPMPSELGFEALPELGDIVGLRTLIQRRLEGLNAAREQFAARRAADDALALANGLRGNEGFEGALRQLDFTALDARLGALESSLATDDGQRFARELRAGFALARRALETLAGEYERGGWRRKTVNDPRLRGRTNRDATGATLEGVLLRADDAPELVPWSAFGGKTVELHQLFFQRLAREYSADELAGIDTLMRATAVLQVIDETADMLQPDSAALLSEAERDSLLEAFEAARNWSVAAGTTSALAREHEAAELLIEALRAATAGAWSRSVASTERLLGGFRSTLLVRLLSDGRPLR